MPLPLPNLDDRRFEDLAAEARERLLRQLPDLARLAPGDPAYALVDLFAWMTETILYRANLIPERQRRAFLNLLQLPLRPALPARSLVCVDASRATELQPLLLPAETGFKAGSVVFTSEGELLPTPLQLTVMIKQTLDLEQLGALGITPKSLSQQYFQPKIVAFEPRRQTIADAALSLRDSLDGRFYLLFTVPRKLRGETDALRAELAGKLLNIGLAPPEEQPSQPFPEFHRESLTHRRLVWELAWVDHGDESKPEDDRLHYTPLEILADSSAGGRQPGVVRLRLPRNPAKLRVPEQDAPQFAGQGDYPPEAPADAEPGRQLFWLRLHSPDDPELALAYLGVNCVQVTAQAVARNEVLGSADGSPDQVFQLAYPQVDPTTLTLEVSQGGGLMVWDRVEQLVGAGPDQPYYTVDPITGAIAFGDGIHGKRPLPGAIVRAQSYRHGGGSATNRPAGSINKLLGAAGGLKVRSEWPAGGGVDAESVEQAEARLPAFLGDRNRAVTADDFRALAERNPINPVARAECRPGLHPGQDIESVRDDVPGIVSLFVMPPGEPAVGEAPRPGKGLLRDVFDHLSERLVAGTELYVLSPEFVPIAVTVGITAGDPASQQTTQRAVQRILLNYLWPLAPGGPQQDGWPMGRAVDLDELRTQAARTSGVLTVGPLRLFYRQDDRWTLLNERERQFGLQHYQLPTLMAVEARPREAFDGSGDPQPPTGLSPSGAIGISMTGGEGTEPPIPVPVVPDSC